MADPVEPDRPMRRPFAAWLQEQRNGGLHDELSDALGELVAVCVQTGKKGSLTLRVSISPQKDEETVLVLDDVKLTAPKHDSRPSLYFPDADGNLLRNNPRQPSLPLREVPGGRADDTPRDLKEAR